MFKRWSHSILAVALTLVVVCVAIIATLAATFSNNMLADFEKSLIDAETAESDAIAARLGQDIRQLKAQGYSLLTSQLSKRLSILAEMQRYDSDYAQTAQYAEQQILLLQSSNSLINNITLYLHSADRKATSLSLSHISTDDENQPLLEKASEQLTYLDGSLCFKITDMGKSMCVLFRLNPLNVQRYLEGFMGESRGNCLSLYVTGPFSARLFARSASTLPATTFSAVGRMISPDASSAYITENRQRYLVTWSYVEDAEAAVCKITPAEKISGQMRSYQQRIIFNYVLILLAAVGVIMLMYFLIDRPLRRTQAALRQIRMGDFSTRIAPTWSSEFTDMFNQFNQMAEKIQTLIEREYELRLLHSKAELKQMQYQINPHFLYNSYFILRAMLYDEEYDQAIQLSGLLGKYLRYITCSGQEYALLQEEIDHAQAYAQIQQIRFSHAVTVKFDQCPEDRLSLRVPRLILQPLIENAFGHGMKAMENGVIAVSFETLHGGALEIRVEDNGQSLTDEALLSLQRRVDSGETEQNGGIALVNIQKRLQFVYNRQSRLLLYRSKMGGLGCAIHIEPLEGGDALDSHDAGGR